MNKPIVELENVSVRYAEHLGLDSVSLKIKEEESIAVVGPNGSGKTTLLTAVNGLGRIIKGKVKIQGKELNKTNGCVLRRDIGFVPQNINIDVRIPIKVREVVRLGRVGKVGFLRRFSQEDKDIVRDTMEFTGIDKFAHTPIGYLSGGEQKKVAIARALAQEPKVLLLDEPLASLDISAKANLLSLIDSIRTTRKLTILMVVHDLSFLPKDSQRIIVLDKGKIVFDGDRKIALSERFLSQLYNTEVTIVKQDEHGVAVRVKTES